jgi:hypothetical protein
MSKDRLLLVTEDEHLAEAISASWPPSLGSVVSLSSFAKVRAQLGPDKGTVLLLAPVSPAEQQDSVRLLQEIHLRRWPIPVLIVETEDTAGNLANFDAYLAGRFFWPEQKQTLLTWLKRHPGLTRSREQPAVQQESRQDQFSQLLSRETPSLARWPIGWPWQRRMR